MSKWFASLSALLCALAATAAVPAAAGAAPGSAAASQVQQARFGARSFGRRPAYRPGYRTRSPYRRAYRRPGLTHGPFGGLLKLFGIAYLLHVLFGVGAGGSPLGLLLLVALLAYVAGRRGRRRVAY